MNQLYILAPAFSAAGLLVFGSASGQNTVPKAPAGICIVQSLKAMKPSNVELADWTQVVNKNLDEKWSWLAIKGRRECQSGSFKIYLEGDVYTPLGISVKGDCRSFSVPVGGKHHVRDNSNSEFSLEVKTDNPYLDPPPVYGLNPVPRFLFESQSGDLCLLFVVPKTVKGLRLSINDAPGIPVPLGK